MECQIGCVLFNDPSIRTQGVACRAGETPFQVRGLHDLTPNQVIWLSNLNWEQARDSGLSRNRRLRTASFLRVNLSHILLELGLDRHPPETQVRCLADLFGQVMQLAGKLYGVARVPPHSLATGILDAVFGGDRPSTVSYPRAILNLLNAANPGYVFSEQRGKANKQTTVRVPFRLHRPTHAAAMLDVWVPSGIWRPVDMPRCTDVVAWITEQERPLLAKIRIRKMDPAASPLINFGLTGYNGGRPREWVCALELVQLAQFMEIDVLELYGAERYIRLPIRADAIKGKLLVQYAAGLLAENLWVAMARFDAAWRTWLMAYDRIQCFLEAMQLAALQAPPVSDYGYGRLFLAMKEGDMLQEQIAFLALKTGLCPPVLPKSPQEPMLVEGVRRFLKTGGAGEIETALAVSGRRDVMLTQDGALTGPTAGAG